MKKDKIIYWVLTILFAAFMLMSSFPDIISSPEAIEIFKHLQYPAYLLPFLGIAKTLGVIVILVPGLPRLKEWAYAGLFFDLAGAVYSGLSVGDPIVQWSPIFIAFVFLFGSYFYWHKYRKVQYSQKEALGNK